MTIRQRQATAICLGILTTIIFGAPSLAAGRGSTLLLRFNDAYLLAQSPSQRLVEQATQKLKKGDLEGALVDLEKALQADPRNFWAYVNRGAIRLQTEDYQNAILDATRAIELDPGNADNWSPYNMRAFAYYRLKNYRSAAQDWALARQFKLPRELLHINLYSRGEALRLAGDLAGSIADCTKSIELFPTPQAYDNRGLAYAQKGDKNLALADFRKALIGFRIRGDTDNLDAVLQRLLALQAEIAGVNLPSPRSWQFPEVIEYARAISPRNLEGRAFNESGLAYPVEQLESLPVASMSPYELQKYADIVTHAFPDAAFVRALPLQSCREFSGDTLNTTALANVAYVSLQARIPSNREEASRCLKELQDVWRRRSG